MGCVCASGASDSVIEELAEKAILTHSPSAVHHTIDRTNRKFKGIRWNVGNAGGQRSRHRSMVNETTRIYGQRIDAESSIHRYRRALGHYRQIRYRRGMTADFKPLRRPVRGRKVVCRKTQKLGSILRLTARGRPKRSARFFLRSSSSGSVGSSGAPRFLAGCFLVSTIPKRSVLAFSFVSSYNIA